MDALTHTHRSDQCSVQASENAIFRSADFVTFIHFRFRCKLRAVRLNVSRLEFQGRRKQKINYLIKP